MIMLTIDQQRLREMICATHDAMMAQDDHDGFTTASASLNLLALMLAPPTTPPQIAVTPTADLIAALETEAAAGPVRSVLTHGAPQPIPTDEPAASEPPPALAAEHEPEPARAAEPAIATKRVAKPPEPFEETPPPEKWSKIRDNTIKRLWTERTPVDIAIALNKLEGPPVSGKEVSERATGNLSLPPWKARGSKPTAMPEAATVGPIRREAEEMFATGASTQRVARELEVPLDRVVEWHTAYKAASR